MSGEAFSTTVRIDPDILMTRGLEAFEVHGITSEEVKQGPSFEQAWMRFLTWIDDVTNSATKYEVESDDDTGLPTLLEDPAVVLVAHNGIRLIFHCFFVNPPTPPGVERVRVRSNRSSYLPSPSTYQSH